MVHMAMSVAGNLLNTKYIIAQKNAPAEAANSAASAELIVSAPRKARRILPGASPGMVKG